MNLNGTKSMLVVGENLKELCQQFQLIDDIDAYDVNSLTLRLDDQIISIEVPSQVTVDYGAALKPEWINESRLSETGLELKRNACVLACSREQVKIPLGYFGLVQTKGSLARLFVSATCNDGQVEAGYQGRITFELTNMGPMKVRIPRGAEIAQLFLFKTSTNRVRGYCGRYQNATKPTIFTTR